MRFCIILLTIIFITSCSNSEITSEIQKNIDSISTKWIPDAREGIRSLSFRKSQNGKLVLWGETNLSSLKKDITAYLERSGIRYIDSLLILPDTTVISKKWGLVTVSVANIKGAPSHSSELTSQAVMGTPVKILKKKGSWILAQTPDFYIGWINDSSLRELTDEEIESWRNTKKIIFLGIQDVIRSPENEVVSDIVSGCILVDSGYSSGVSSVVLPDGRRGRIEGGQTADFEKWFKTVKPDAASLIVFAKELAGYPYLWGGTSTKAMDCSGFIKTVYFTGGIILARDASLQFMHGIPVDVSSSPDSLRPGDLLYFGHLNSSGEKRITHTGMYIGDTEVIHSSGMVRINSLDSTRSNYSSFLRKTLLGARRVIGFTPERGTESVSMNSWYINHK